MEKKYSQWIVWLLLLMLFEKNSIYFSKWPKRIGFSLHQIVYCDRIVFEKDLWALRTIFCINSKQTHIHIYTYNFTTILLYNNKIWYVQTKWNSIFSVYLRFKKIKFASRNELIHGRISYSFSLTWWNPFYGFECECSNLRASKLQKALFCFRSRSCPRLCSLFDFETRKRLILHLAQTVTMCLILFTVASRSDGTSPGNYAQMKKLHSFFFSSSSSSYIYFIVQCAQISDFVR